MARRTIVASALALSVALGGCDRIASFISGAPSDGTVTVDADGLSLDVPDAVGIDGGGQDCPIQPLTFTGLSSLQAAGLAIDDRWPLDVHVVSAQTTGPFEYLHYSQGAWLPSVNGPPVGSVSALAIAVVTGQPVVAQAADGAANVYALTPKLDVQALATGSRIWLALAAGSTTFYGVMVSNQAANASTSLLFTRASSCTPTSANSPRAFPEMAATGDYVASTVLVEGGGYDVRVLDADAAGSCTDVVPGVIAEPTASGPAAVAIDGATVHLVSVYSGSPWQADIDAASWQGGTVTLTQSTLPYSSKLASATVAATMNGTDLVVVYREGDVLRLNVWTAGKWRYQDGLNLAVVSGTTHVHAVAHEGYLHLLYTIEGSASVGGTYRCLRL